MMYCLNLATNDDVLVINNTNFLSCFCSFFITLNLPQYYKSNIDLEMWDQRLNYDSHLFTAEIRKTNENLIYSGNFRLYWNIEG